MDRLLRIMLFSAVLGLALPAIVIADNWRQRLEILNFTGARAVALGGAVTSIPGDLDVAIFNPAAVQLYRYPQAFRVTFCLDPLSTAVATADPRGHPVWGRLDTSERLALLGIALRGLLLRWNFFDVALALGRDLSVSPADEARSIRANWHGFPRTHGHYLAGRLRFANVVSIGASVFYAQDRRENDVQRGYGVSYGVHVTSHEGLRFGVSYVKLPQPARPRLAWEGRLADGTVDLGLSRTFFGRWTLALDVRNLSDEGAPILREFHLGSELLVFRHLAIRTGFYREAHTNCTVFTAGMGLLDRNRFVSPDRCLRRQSFAFQYAVRARIDGHARELAHFLSFLVRL